MTPIDLETSLAELGYKQVAANPLDTAEGRPALYTKKLDSTAGTELDGLSLEIALDDKKIVLSSDLFGALKKSREISLDDVKGNDPEVLKALVSAAERDAWSRPDNLARTQVSATDLEKAVADAFQQDAEKYDLNFAKGRAPAAEALKSIGFQQLADNDAGKEFFLRVIDGGYSQSLTTDGDQFELTLLKKEPDGTIQEIAKRTGASTTPEETLLAATRQLVDNGVNRDGLVLQKDAKEGTVDAALRGEAADLKFYRLGRTNENDPEPGTNYARDLSDGSKQHLFNPDDVNLPVVIETRDSTGALKTNEAGQPLSAQVDVAREQGEADDDYRARKVAAAAAKEAEQQRKELEEAEGKKIVAIENENKHFQRRKEKDKDVTLNHDQFLTAVFKRLDYTTQRAEKDQTMFGAFSRGYQSQMRRAAESKARRESKVKATAVFRRHGREMAGLESTLGEDNPGISIRTVKEALGSPKRDAAKINGVYLGRSEHLYVFLIEGTKDAIAFPAKNMALSSDHGLKKGDKTALVWNFQKVFVPARGQVFQNGKELTVNKAELANKRLANQPEKAPER